MMEKRFITNEVGCIVDLYDEQLRNYDGQEIVDLLNDLSDKIEDLEKENNELKGRIINAIKDSHGVECSCSPCVAEEYVVDELLK